MKKIQIPIIIALTAANVLFSCSEKECPKKINILNGNDLSQVLFAVRLKCGDVKRVGGVEIVSNNIDFDGDNVNDSYTLTERRVLYNTRSSEFIQGKDNPNKKTLYKNDSEKDIQKVKNVWGLR